MADIFSKTTSGGRAGQFVYNDLNKSQEKQIVAFSESRVAKYEEQKRERVDNYVIVLQALDQECLKKVNIINSKKREILAIIDTARNEKEFTNKYINNISNAQSDEIASKISYTAGISTFTYNCRTTRDIVGEIEFIRTVCNTGTRAPVYPDILAAWYYPNLETLKANVDFYKDGETYIRMANNTLGVGVTAHEFGDAGGVTGTTGIVTSSSPLGSYYFFSNINAIVPGASQKISTLVNEIETLRGEVNELLFGEDGTNQIRSLKTMAQVDLWYEKKSQTQPQTSSINYSGASNSLQSNQNFDIIQNYNA